MSIIDKRRGRIRPHKKSRATAKAGNCLVCGIFRGRLHKDHIIPSWRGGSNTPENWQYICANCHQDKTVAEIQSPEYRDYLSLKFTGTTRGPMPLETRARISAAMRGRNPVISIERNHKISKALTGRTLSLSHREALSKAGLGHSVSPESRKKMSVTKLTNAARKREIAVAALGVL